MNPVYLKQTHQYQLLAKAFLCLMAVYLLFHLFLSERSIPTWITLSQQQDQLTVQVAQLTQTRDKLKDRAIRLRPATMDMDLVEDYAIFMLGHGRANSIIIAE
jgi:cell division protein FtsB